MTNKEYIQAALRWSDQKYGEVVMNTAFAWINLHFNDSDVMVDVFSRSAMFWKWWKNQWEKRDAYFIELTSIDLMKLPVKEDMRKVIYEVYSEIHEIDRMVIKPNRMVMKEARSIIKKEIKTLKNDIKNVD